MKAQDLRPVGMIAAMSTEIAPLLKRVDVRERLRIGGFRAWRFHLADKDCLLVETGIGTRRAGEAARALLAVRRAGLLLSFGIAGAVEADLRIGDVVVGRRVYALRAAALESPLGLAGLSPDLEQATATALRARRAGLLPGTIVTTPGPQAIQGRPSVFPHPVLDMETAAVAQAAAQAGVPLLALRAISDNPAEPIPFPVEDIYDEQFRQRTGRLLLALLRRPSLLARLSGTVRNARIAEENAALAVTTILAGAWTDFPAG